jgi:hypothetical protein
MTPAQRTMIEHVLAGPRGSAAVQDGIEQQLGERGVVELINVMGWYGTVSMFLNVDRYPLPAGARPELKPLKGRPGPRRRAVRAPSPADPGA